MFGLICLLFKIKKKDFMSFAIKPNLQLIYVSDIDRSTKFYTMLFKTQPVFVSPRYVAYSAGGDEAMFALWSGSERKPDLTIPRFGEIGIGLTSNQEVDLLAEEWKKNTAIKFLEEPRTEVFGRTFVIQDPDGHLIRVAPRD